MTIRQLAQDLKDRGWENMLHLIHSANQLFPGISNKQLYQLGRRLGAPITSARLHQYKLLMKKGPPTQWKSSNYYRAPLSRRMLTSTPTTNLPSPQKTPLPACLRQEAFYLFRTIGVPTCRAFLKTFREVNRLPGPPK